MKKFRQTALICVLLIAAAMLLSGCAGETDERVTINVYNWGEYISDGFQGTLDTNAAFEEYFNKNLASKYGFYVEVNYTTYATNEDMYSKLSSGAGTYDIIIPSDYMIERMI